MCRHERNEARWHAANLDARESVVLNPDLEHRIAILRQKAHLDHLELTIPEEVVRFIAENVRSSVRELEGSIIKLLAYASLKHREITVEVAREALRDKLKAMDGTPGGGPALNTYAIQQAVSKEWGVTNEGLRSKTRTKNLTVPRQVAMFGGRDHSTVIHSLERVAAMMKEDPTFAQRVGKIQAALESLRN